MIPSNDRQSPTHPPDPSDGFFWSSTPSGPVLKCEALEAHADHFFTTRALALRGPDSERGWAQIAEEIGVSSTRLLRLRQVHGTTCVSVDGLGSIWPPNRPPEADAIIATNQDVALAVRVADCMPVLVADRHRRLVAAAHAGWRGTAAGIVGCLVKAIATQFDVDPGDLVAVIGPSIGPCCYEVGEEVHEAFRVRHGASAGAWFVEAAARSGRRRLDLWSATRDQLVAVGIPAPNISVAALCTATHLEWFHSYRAEGARAGRMAGVIRITRT